MKSTNTNDDKPPYLLASDALKHLKNRNYGLLEETLLELWAQLSRLAEQNLVDHARCADNDQNKAEP